MKRVRLQDLYIGFESDDAVLVRSHARGIVLRAPAFAVAVLSACGEPRTADEVAGSLGEPGRRLYDVLVEAGVLVAPEDAASEAIPHSLYGELDRERDRLANRAQYAAYREALEAVVKDKRVVVFGGSSGVLPVLAANAGASLVHVIDNSARLDAVELVAVASGVRDRVRLEEGHPSEVELEARADVAVTDQLGPLGLPDGWDAWCERHLAPGGLRIPSSVRIASAPVMDEAPLATLRKAFEGHDVELGPLREAVTSQLRPARFEEGQLGAMSVDADEPEPGPGGAAFWLELELCDSVSWSTRDRPHWRPTSA